MRMPATLTAVFGVLELLSSFSAGARQATPGTQTLPPLRVSGKHLVDPSGKPVTLRGVNLGNWLLIETWMLGCSDYPDQHTIDTVLRERFGAAEARRFMSLYRDHYITPRDFQLIRSYGFNVVRLPFAWELLEEHEPPHRWREDAFHYLDRALSMAQDAGIYVILDLHGAPGGQSREHHTYRERQNALFTTPEYLDRTVRIWERLAERYRDHPAVVAYDLLNEPYGDYLQDLRPELVSLMDRLYAAVRKHDPDTLILFPGTLQGSIEFYGNPADKNQKNVGFTEHYYPGLFGDPSRPRSHEVHLRHRVTARAEYIDRLNVPFLVGEFNVVLERSGGDAMMRRHFDEYARQGWIATMWSYKLLKSQPGAGPDNWYLVTNAEALQSPNLRTAPAGEIETFFRSLSTMPLATDESLRDALQAEVPPPITTPEVANLPKKAPQDPAPPGWNLAPVNSPTPAGGFARGADANSGSLVGGGADIWTNDDSFQYLARTQPGDVSVSVRINVFGDSHQYAKAGPMIRQSGSKDAAHVLLNVFPTGRIVLASRAAAGGQMVEKRIEPPLGEGAFPAELRLVRVGEEVTAYARRGGSDGWQGVGAVAFPRGEALVGLAVCSHDTEQLTEAVFQDLVVAPPAGR